MTSAFYVAFLAAASIAVQAAEFTDKEKAFIQDAYRDNMRQVVLGQIAVDKAQNSEVKQLGQRLMTDHRQANEQLRPIAQAAGVTLAQQREAAQAQGQAPTPQQREQAREQIQMKLEQVQKKLQSLSGEQFDKEFVKVELKDHTKDIQMYQRAAQEAENSQLKAYIQQTLPTLRQHLQATQTAASAVGLSAAEISAATRPEEGSAVGGAASQPEQGAGKSGQQQQQQQQQQPDSSQQSPTRPTRE